MDRAWIIDSRGLAKKVLNASLPAEDQINDCGACAQCPNCQYLIDNSDVVDQWPGFPAGVKFEPSDVELLDHLAAKRGDGDLEPHKFIDNFIPTLKCDHGICYTHPENLPGARKDGSSVHFFYKITKAFASGRRKRRRIEDQENLRWHKTGTTKPVMENGVRKGFKKIMVLYANSKKGSKPNTCNWVMHQYHIGADENEKDGEFVVSKIFCQLQKETDKKETSLIIEEETSLRIEQETSLTIEESEVKTVKRSPQTPMAVVSDADRQEKTPTSDCLPDGYFLQPLVQEKVYIKDPSHASSGSFLEDDMEHTTSLAEDCEAVDLSRENSFVFGEMINPYAVCDDLRQKMPSSTLDDCDISAVQQRDGNDFCGISELDDLVLDTPPDFRLSDLQFASQDSVFDWVDVV